MLWRAHRGQSVEQNFEKGLTSRTCVRLTVSKGTPVAALHQAVEAVAAVDLDTLTDGESDTALDELVR